MMRRMCSIARRRGVQATLLLTAVAVLAIGCNARQDGAQAGNALSGPNCHFWAKLTSSMSTQTSKAGDPVTALVMVHDTIRGGLLQGKVEEADDGTLRFSFDTLTFDGKTYAIRAYLMSITNSKGWMGRDDQGQRIRMDGDGGGFIAYGDSTSLDEGAEVKFAAWEE
ncbi:MAG: hypothetical protein WB812_02095 [Woeseiaceae bacterium]